MSDTKSVIAGWFVDPLTGEFQNDVYLELDIDTANASIIQQSLKSLLIDEDEPKAVNNLKALACTLRMINYRSRVQPCHIGLFEVPKDWTRKDVELAIRHLDQSKLQKAIKAYKRAFSHI